MSLAVNRPAQVNVPLKYRFLSSSWGAIGCYQFSISPFGRNNALSSQALRSGY
jgi:hypothetical protein